MSTKDQAAASVRGAARYRRGTLALTALSCGGLLFVDHPVAQAFAMAVLLLPIFEVVRYPRHTNFTKPLVYLTLALVFMGLGTIAIRTTFTTRGTVFVPWLGVIGGVVATIVLVAWVRHTFSGVYTPTLYTDLFEEFDRLRGSELVDAVKNLLDAALATFALNILSLAGILVLLRVLRYGAAATAVEEPLLALNASIFLTVLVRCHTFLVSKREARALFLSVILRLLLGGLIALPVLSGLQEGKGIPLFPLFQLSPSPDEGTYRELFGTVMIVSALASIACELSLFGVVSFLDLRRSYFDFLGDANIKAETIADSRMRFMEAAISLVEETSDRGSGSIAIMTQTAGDQWEGLNDAIQTIAKQPDFTVEILCPPDPRNLGNIAHLMRFPGVSVYCGEVQHETEIKFLIARAPGMSRILLGYPSSAIGKYFAKARWGYVFRDPMIVESYALLFDAAKRACHGGRTTAEILLSALLIRADVDCNPADVIGDGRLDAVWCADGHSVRLSLAEGSARLLANAGALAVSLRQVCPELQVDLPDQRSHAGDTALLVVDFDGVCISGTHYVELARALGQEYAAESLLRGLRTHDEEQLAFVLRQMVKLFAGLPEEAFRRVAAGVTVDDEIGRLFGEAIKRGWRICVITNGSASFVRQVFASSGHVPDVWGTELNFERGVCQGEIRGRLISGAAKRKAATALHQITRGPIVVIGNGWNDFHMLQYAAHTRGRGLILAAALDQSGEELAAATGGTLVRRGELLQAVFNDDHSASLPFAREGRASPFH